MIGPTRSRSAALPAILLASLLWSLAACAPSGEKLLARAEEQLAGGEYRAAMIDLAQLPRPQPG